MDGESLLDFYMIDHKSIRIAVTMYIVQHLPMLGSRGPD